MSTTLSILSFVKVQCGLKTRHWVYGYVADMVPGLVTICYDMGIKPVNETFDSHEVVTVSEKTFWSKTKGQTALHSQYWDAKERHVHDPRVEPSLSSNAGAALKIADEITNLVDGLTHLDMPDSVVSLKLKYAARRYKTARLKHVAEG